MPRDLKRYYEAQDFHFITSSCYRRLPLFARRKARDVFLSVLERVRRRYEFVVIEAGTVKLNDWPKPKFAVR